MKLYQKYLAVILLMLVIFIGYFYTQNKQEFTDRVHTVLLNILNKQIENEKARAFNFAFALSQNETLQRALKNNDAKKAYEILQTHMKALETFSGSKIRIQILSKDITIFARSWDNSDAGVNVKAYRPDLVEMKKTLSPHLSYEAARRLVLIASIPIVENKKCLGFVEVIQRFASLEKYFAQYDIDMIALLDDKYQNQSVLLKNNPRIANMIVANNGANINHIQNLRRLDLNKLESLGSVQTEEYLYISKVILNSKAERIGYFILILSQEKLKLFSSFENELESFFSYSRKDLYSTIVNKDKAFDPYTDLTAKELVSLKKCTTQKDRACLEKNLRNKLNRYTKEELISLLLDANSQKISRGKIK
ncbi:MULTISPECIES: cache domain-containing protein [Sulfurimonas]|uniref:cache domain-containing protein n=1 Tax=Sulfurimonas TaxID=202746 RepID=UPI00125F62A9|nr:cache domain-containing protein [Sulfurimonas hydrogeniphila]